MLFFTLILAFIVSNLNLVLASNKTVVILGSIQFLPSVVEIHQGEQVTWHMMGNTKLSLFETVNSTSCEVAGWKTPEFGSNHSMTVVFLRTPGIHYYAASGDLCPRMHGIVKVIPGSLQSTSSSLDTTGNDIQGKNSSIAEPAYSSGRKLNVGLLMVFVAIAFGFM